MVERGNAPLRGYWSLPGGGVETGERLEQAIRREVREETGLECVCGSLVGWVERLEDDLGSGHFVILDFDVTVLDDRAPVAGTDAAEAAWVELSQVAELRLVDGLAEFLHEHGYLDVIT